MVKKQEQNFEPGIFDSENLLSVESKMSDFFWKLLRMLLSCNQIFLPHFRKDFFMQILM